MHLPAGAERRFGRQRSKTETREGDAERAVRAALEVIAAAASASLARLCIALGHPGRARDVLGPAHGRFIAGLKCPDVEQAGVLLDELGISDTTRLATPRAYPWGIPRLASSRGQAEADPNGINRTGRELHALQPNLRRLPSRHAVDAADAVHVEKRRAS